jgi:hypothetical protein
MARRRTGRERELLADKPINGAWLAVQESPLSGKTGENMRQASVSQRRPMVAADDQR